MWLLLFYVKRIILKGGFYLFYELKFTELWPKHKLKLKAMFAFVFIHHQD